MIAKDMANRQEIDDITCRNREMGICKGAFALRSGIILANKRE